ncbi:hypothetical protein AFIC_001237 [[Pseudomonas] carboxydohydrogena]|uniref:Uncharacterized protein n=1 Tax=Afipia carboxydohydrogena TaxID=290 RepID=A0ABY8BVQ3_AFICR|nr:hypothetical protein [[Pseudomonas] carboxydohydrogena]WEF52740.1 hypothetical protein AFIC_001237 [[Pseudomonas] carboxydohydrogena]
MEKKMSGSTPGAEISMSSLKAEIDELKKQITALQNQVAHQNNEIASLRLKIK